MIYQPVDVAALDFRCPACDWRGKGTEALAEVNSVVACPRCREYLLRDERDDADQP